MNAVPMVNECYRHQNPELFEGETILPEFPRESNATGEDIPSGMNREGWVAEEGGQHESPLPLQP